MVDLRITHPDLPFWVDVRVRHFGGRWLAVANLAGEPELGMGETAEEALDGALAVFGLPIARELMRSAVGQLDYAAGG